MLRLSILELFFGAIPEQFIFVFGVYILSNTPFNKKRILISSLISGLVVYLVRMLPIYMGVHLLFLMIITTLLLFFINKISIVKIIPSLLILVITRLVTEVINVFVINNLFNIPPEYFLNNRLLKLLYWTPSTFLFALIVYIIFKKRYNPVKGEKE